MNPSKSNLTKNNGLLDRLWKTVGKEEATCEICATLPPNKRTDFNQLHAHHIVGRTNRLLRWDLKNRIWLCAIHHTLGGKSAHNNPMWFTQWFQKNRPEIYTYLMEKDIIPYKQWQYDELLEMYNYMKGMK